MRDKVVANRDFIYSSSFDSLEKILKAEGIFLSDGNDGVKLVDEDPEKKAIHAANVALCEAKKLLSTSEEQLTDAAKMIERIQVEAARAERASFITHQQRAEKAAQIANQISLLSREFFHTLKARRKAPPQAA